VLRDADQHQRRVAAEQALLRCALKAAASLVTTTSSAPSLRASSALLGVEVNTTVWAPSACDSLTPMWPRPPSPTTPTFLPWVMFQWRSGDQQVMPAHNSGAVAASGSLSEIRRQNASSTTMWLE
jgi:hypothetical protein